MAASVRFPDAVITQTSARVRALAEVRVAFALAPLSNLLDTLQNTNDAVNKGASTSTIMEFGEKYTSTVSACIRLWHNTSLHRQDAEARKAYPTVAEVSFFAILCTSSPPAVSEELTLRTYESFTVSALSASSTATVSCVPKIRIHYTDCGRLIAAALRATGAEIGSGSWGPIGRWCTSLLTYCAPKVYLPTVFLPSS